MNFVSKILNSSSIPYGVRVLTHATAIRWIGWGFAEALIPVLLFSLAKNYANASLLRSAYDVAFIIALPVAGMLADRFYSSTLVLFGLFLYLFVGSSYFLAGLTGLALFAIIARLVNGVSYSFDVLGRDTYTRLHTPKEKIASAFGYVDTVANFWWIIAAVAGIFLVKYFSITALLFMIVPTSMIAALIVWRFRRVGWEKKPSANINTKLKGAYVETIREIGAWGWNLRLLAIFNFFYCFL